jgi:hypothetical protein
MALNGLLNQVGTETGFRRAPRACDLDDGTGLAHYASHAGLEHPRLSSRNTVIDVRHRILR